MQSEPAPTSPRLLALQRGWSLLLTEFRGCAGTWKLENWWAAGDRSWKGSWAHSTWQVRTWKPHCKNRAEHEKGALGPSLWRGGWTCNTDGTQGLLSWEGGRSRREILFWKDMSTHCLSREDFWLIADVFALRENMNCTFRRKQNLAEWWMFRNFHKGKVMIDSQLREVSKKIICTTKL